MDIPGSKFWDSIVGSGGRKKGKHAKAHRKWLLWVSLAFSWFIIYLLTYFILLDLTFFKSLFSLEAGEVKDLRYLTHRNCSPQKKMSEKLRNEGLIRSFPFNIVCIVLIDNLFMWFEHHEAYKNIQWKLFLPFFTLVVSGPRHDVYFGPKKKCIFSRKGSIS